MSADDVLAQLRPLGKDSYKRLLMKNHSVREPVFGVPISQLKVFQKRHRNDHALALDLYATGNYDAMYLAGLIADDAKMSRKDLERWVKQAIGGALASCTVAWVAAGSPHAWAAALDWIESNKEHVAVAGWSTLASFVALTQDADLDLVALRGLLARVEAQINTSPDLVKYAMNNFVICLGTHVKPLRSAALKTAENLGHIEADLGNNSCQFPFAPDKLRKAEANGQLGKKRRTVKC